MFSDIYRGKKVVVTGHTGFKGSWLIVWLKMLGADVVGISNEFRTTPNHFDSANLQSSTRSIVLDIRNGCELKRLLVEEEPDFIFHLAAQPLVRRAYLNPSESWSTNLLGTVNVLEALRSFSKKCVAILITSDKCYDNVEWVWGYRETDKLGGGDPYSASKGAAEIAVTSYYRSYFSGDDSLIRLATARAGNVIGGGDWSPDRIIPDCTKAWAKGESAIIRNSSATRPWQHVLEPLSGYLTQGQLLSNEKLLNGESFNFGPDDSSNHSVGHLVELMASCWGGVRWIDEERLACKQAVAEARLLRLNCDKADALLKWSAVMSFEETVKATANWYKDFYTDSQRTHEYTAAQIKEYSALAKERGRSWALK